MKKAKKGPKAAKPVKKQKGEATEDSVYDAAHDVFTEITERTKTKLLIDLYEVEFDAATKLGAFDVNVNCRPEWSQIVGEHEIVQGPLSAFLDEMHGRFPGAQFEVNLMYDPIDTGKGIDAAVELALRFAGANDLVEELGLTRRRS